MMDILKVLAVLTALAATAAAQDVDCTDPNFVNSTMVKCFEAAGIPAEDVMKFMPAGGALNLNVTEEDFMKQCTKQDQYLQAGSCVANETAKCVPDGGMNFMPEPQKSAQMIKTICSDPNLNIKCIVGIASQATEISDCVTSKIDFSQLGTKTEQEIICESTQVGLQCTVDKLRECDDYTATVYEGMASMAMPASCTDLVVG